jgi:hypothetical protein
MPRPSVPTRDAAVTGLRRTQGSIGVILKVLLLFVNLDLEGIGCPE